MIRAFIFGVWAFAAAAVSAAPSPCAQLAERLHDTYGFRPSKSTRAQADEKSKAMDAVWEAVQQDPEKLVPCLKEALAKPTDDTWFLFDGSQLLVSIDPSRESKQALFDALSRVSLDDVDLRSWVRHASALGLDGFDTTALGKRWLAYPNAKYWLPEHGAYEVDRENGAMFIFGAAEERFATPALAEICRTSMGAPKEIAAQQLMSQATPEALREVVQLDTSGLLERTMASRRALLEGPALISPRKQPVTTRAELLAAFSAFLAGDEGPFNTLIETVPDGERDLVAVSTPADLEIIRKVRRRYIARNNQHAIEYYNQFTQILMTLVWKEELVGSPKAKRIE